METGIQVSSLKPLLCTAQQVQQAFCKIAQMGAAAVQLQWIDKSVPAHAVAQALSASGLRAVSLQDLSTAIGEDLPYYLELLRAADCPDLCVSRVPPQYRSAAGVEQFAARLRALAEQLAQQGRTVSFHPCAPDFDVIDGVCLTERLMELLPTHITLCLDLYHVARVGRPLPQTVEQFGSRISMVHFKDYRPGPDGAEQLVPAGQGVVDWAGAAAACQRAGVRYAFVEQETWNRDPYACLQEALDWLNAECRAGAQPAL